MMTNLFSIFDPSSSIMSSAWLSPMLLILVPAATFWNIKTSFTKILTSVINALMKEVSFSLKSTEKGVKMMISMSLTIILVTNALALYPHVFSLTSQLTITMPLALLFWIPAMLFGWLHNTKHMMVHLLPQGTPPLLMPFMVLIEITSTMIRPLTLCVRLTANLIAGHLLMSFLGGAFMKIPLASSMAFMAAPLILSILESAVACIQAYVFMTLITLYTAETK